jgi:Undecaprenyl-phosphate galactose phosphotransferase WbaP
LLVKLGPTKQYLAVEKRMMHRNNWLVSSIFIAGDGATLYGIFYLAVILRNLLTGLPFNLETIAPFTQLGLLFCLGILYIQGLYPGYGLTAVKELERMGKAVTLAFFLLAAVSYLNRPFQAFPRPILLITWLLALFSLPLLHFVLRNLLSRTAWYGLPVIIFGDSSWGEEVADSLRRVRRLGWRPEGLLPFDKILHLDNSVQKHAQMAILAPSTDLPVEEYARLLNQRFHKVVLLRKTDHFGSLWVEPRDLDGYLGLEFQYHLLAQHNRWLKRLIDIIGSLILLVLLSPLLALLAVFIAIDSPGSVFFRQERIGQKSKHFRILKFRTMVVGAEEKLTHLLEDDPRVKAEYEKFHKLENDPRTTSLGRLLRKFSLDELPQLWNVFIGDMSLTGPRAYMPSELGSIGSYAPIILRVNPGMTGWWQVLGRHNTTFEKRLEMDEYYISNWSLWMDVYILLKTVTVLLQGTGA